MNPVLWKNFSVVYECQENPTISHSISHVTRYPKAAHSADTRTTLLVLPLPWVGEARVYTLVNARETCKQPKLHQGKWTGELCLNLAPQPTTFTEHEAEHDSGWTRSSGAWQTALSTINTPQSPEGNKRPKSYAFSAAGYSEVTGRSHLASQAF